MKVGAQKRTVMKSQQGQKKIIKDEHNALLQFIHISLSLSWMSKLSQDGIPTIVDKFSRNQKHKT